MKVYLTSAYPFHFKNNFAVKWLSESSIADPYKIHSLSNNPETADIILFVEHHPGNDPYFFEVLSSKLFKKFKEKCYLYHDADWVIPLIPGIYPSIENRIFNAGITQPGHYIARQCENEAVKFQDDKPKPKFLFSFIGASATHTIRTEILKLHHPECFLKDTSGKNSWELNPAEKKKFENDYVSVSQKSSFILCPRGLGPNTYRLYETMEMGISPVIISDQWVPTYGPEWENFSIRIPESQIKNIPNLLEENKHLASKMGKLARCAWEEWFCKAVSFHHIIEACNKLQKERMNYGNIEKLKTCCEFLKPFHFRNLLRYTKRRLELR
ncbi:exostosin domain-containing protein [Cyclobacterium jeungdonense]|uniref:Exostosin family protein n=1 Tax=Cyclobacterium jeungdonense TaxID=708087 RepID=A0ABT8CB23_9BACT|nr:exostosin family protein [Cyclobacterium jeungdonense]MDN3688876.1 exostosin family protein [Cyclobacterium jeungdonense]